MEKPKVVVAVLAVLAVAFLAQRALAENACSGTLSVEGYVVKCSSSVRNIVGISVLMGGAVAEDARGDWVTHYLPAERKTASEYYAEALFWHNYTVSGTWAPEASAKAFITWESWVDPQVSVVRATGACKVKVAYSQFSWTWEVTGDCGGVRSFSAPSRPDVSRDCTIWLGASSGPSMSFSSNTVVEGSGKMSGWLGYSVFLGRVRGKFYLYGRVYQPSPPKPDTLNVYGKDASSGRAILNASVNICWFDRYWWRYYCANTSTPAMKQGDTFKLAAYTSSSAWLAVTDVNWCAPYLYCYAGSCQWKCKYLNECAFVRGLYSFSYSGNVIYSEKRFTGTFLLKFYVVGKFARVYIEVENPPGSNLYTPIAENVLPDWGGGWYYENTLQLNNQRIRLRFAETSQWYGPQASGWITLGESIQSSLQPAGWEVYKGSELIIKTSSTTTPSFGKYEGQDYTALALYENPIKLTIKLVKPDGSPAYGARVRVDGTEYVDDADGVCDGSVSITVRTGTHAIEIPATYYSGSSPCGSATTTFDARTHWRRYAFWKWSDGDTSNPRTVTVNSDTTLTAYVFDERRLWILYDPHFNGDPWGAKAVQLPNRYGDLVNKMLPYNTSLWLRIGETATLQAVEGGSARFLYWTIGSECFPRTFYTASPTVTVSFSTSNCPGLAVRAVFRLGPTNQTLFLPGEGVPNPIFWSVYQQAAVGGTDGRKGTWQLTVTAVHQRASSQYNVDNRTWIQALLVKPGTLEAVWVPVNGTWELYMARDWSATAHKPDDCSADNPYSDACRYVAYSASDLGDFPQVTKGAPSGYRGWYLIGLAAWKPLLPGESYGDLSLVWSGGATYALYNVTFKHVESGTVYWQPVAVSALEVRSAVARYQLGSYDAQLGRSPIYMRIEAQVGWRFLPPDEPAPGLPEGATLRAIFKVHPPLDTVLLALENDAGGVAQFAQGTAVGDSSRLYTLSLGDTELFYRDPNGLSSGARSFSLVARFRGRAGKPGARVDEGLPVKAEIAFTLAPATAVIADWKNNDPQQLVVDWDCFRSGSEPFGTSRMGVNYAADLYVEYGRVDEKGDLLPPLARRKSWSGAPTALVDVNPDYWVVFYPIPAGGSYSVSAGSTVPVPLCTKYPPRSKGG